MEKMDLAVCNIVAGVEAKAVMTGEQSGEENGTSSKRGVELGIEVECRGREETRSGEQAHDEKKRIELLRTTPRT